MDSHDALGRRSCRNCKDLNPIDPSFRPGVGVDGRVQNIGIDADRKILLAGTFTAVQGTGWLCQNFKTAKGLEREKKVGQTRDR